MQKTAPLTTAGSVPRDGRRTGEDANLRQCRVVRR